MEATKEKLRKGRLLWKVLKMRRESEKRMEERKGLIKKKIKKKHYWKNITLIVVIDKAERFQVGEEDKL